MTEYPDLAFDRLAAALRGLPYDMTNADMARRIFAADPTFETDLDFGAAWRAVVDSLPEGWCLEIRRRTDGDVWARASDPAVQPQPQRGDNVTAVIAVGPPTAALSSLTVQLQTMAGSRA